MLSSRSPGLTLTDRPRERHDRDPARAGGPERRGGSVRGRAARIDVVDDADLPRRGAGAEGAAHVAPPLGEAKTALPWQGPRSHEERLDRQFPAAAELAGEPLGGVVTALEAAIAVRGHE